MKIVKLTLLFRAAKPVDTSMIASVYVPQCPLDRDVFTYLLYTVLQ